MTLRRWRGTLGVEIAEMDEFFDKFSARRIGDDDLKDLFIDGSRQVKQGRKDYTRHLTHLVTNLRESFAARETNPVILQRKYMGLMLRLEKLGEAVLLIDEGYGQIWDALELALDDAPMKALSENSRKGFEGRMQRNPKALAQAGAWPSIIDEWRRWRVLKQVKYRSASDFARKMNAKFPQLSDGRIRNAQTEWMAAQSKLSDIDPHT